MSFKKIKATQAQRAAQARLDTARKEDGWINVLNGIGSAQGDKRRASYFQRDVVNWQTAEDLWRSDDMAARLVECMPDEMTREGFELQIQDEVEGEATAVNNPEQAALKGAKQDARRRTDYAVDDPSAQGNKPNGAPGTSQPDPAGEPVPEDEPQVSVDEDSKRVAELMMARCEDLDVLDKVRQCLYFTQAYGGGAILVGANDGQADWRKPLKEDSIRSIDYLNVLEPRELLPVYYYGDPRAEKYGEPMIYQLNRIMIAGEVPADQAYMQVHETRIIRFDGIRVGRRQMISNAGWGDPIFNRVAQVVQDFQQVWQGAALILSDFSQALLKIKGLAEMVAKNGKTAVQQRAQAISAARSIAGMVLIDAEEDFSRTPTPLSGFPEMLDRFCNRLAAAVKMPVTILMGQSPAGLNATGASDLEWFSNQVRAEQTRKMKRPMRRLLKLLFLDQSGPTGGEEPTNWMIKFPPLKQMSETEKADVRLKTSQADAADIGSGVLLPAEVAKSRFGGDGYSTETQVDLELRAQTRAAVQEDPGDGKGGPSIEDPFHTGEGEPGSQPKPAPETPSTRKATQKKDAVGMSEQVPDLDSYEPLDEDWMRASDEA